MSFSPPAFPQTGNLSGSLNSRAPARGPRQHGSASIIPVVVSAAAFLLGSACLFLGDSIAIGLAGYFAAGFITIICLGWDSVSQRKGLTNPNFNNKPVYRTLLRIIVGAGFAVAILNLVKVAMPIAEALSNKGGSQ
jgi:hypothetical protein